MSTRDWRADLLHWCRCLRLEKGPSDHSPGVDDEEAETGTVKLLGRSAEAFHGRVVGHFGESMWLVLKVDKSR